jgi:hypothetical protein
MWRHIPKDLNTLTSYWSYFKVFCTLQFPVLCICLYFKQRNFIMQKCFCYMKYICFYADISGRKRCIPAPLCCLLQPTLVHVSSTYTFIQYDASLWVPVNYYIMLDIVNICIMFSKMGQLRSSDGWCYNDMFIGMFTTLAVKAGIELCRSECYNSYWTADCDWM